ncbi:splicing factor Cactin-like [Panonychus citri]|uniref:splicing factor Cactin-like n=1 Tax=Panonychus citri TaxID=50023 RepID=UPI0023081D22|nr:splicing factor Cactin-like [Panonychus citri]
MLNSKSEKILYKTMGYSNDNNPFGDSQLLQPLVWGKKCPGNKKMNESKLNELKKMKKNREEREREREKRATEMEDKQRDAEASKFRSYNDNEDQFVFKQANLRSGVRLKEGRPKTIDLLVDYINASNDGQGGRNLIEPFNLLNGLRLFDLQDLKGDINLYKKFDNENLQYWTDLEIIVNTEIKKLHSSSTGIHPTVAADAHKIIDNKTPEQLASLEISIKKKMDNDRGVIDITYWESLLEKLQSMMARARLHEKHQQLMVKMKTNHLQDEGDQSEKDVDDDSISAESCDKDYMENGYSPELSSGFDLDSNLIVNPVDDFYDLERARRFVSQSSSFIEPTNEGILRIEETTIQDPGISSWCEKYRPRKPRFFNRVHTGFEWNKYNQTHYDIDNPPPKIVQGYKFNIFYPDLINKGQAPTYTLTTCQDNKDFAIIRFKAGPPYEDIAFKIVNREWNYSHKSGFRCQFINNILQLWFHFKRYRYRR